MADRQQVIKDLDRVISLIRTDSKDISAEEKKQMVTDTLDQFDNYVSPGWLKYRKSVSSDSEAGAVLEWEDEGAYCYGLNGEKFIDCLGGFGIFTCGHRNPEILDVVNHSGHEIPEDCRPSYYHTESGSVSGTWKPEDKEESHRGTTVITNKQGQNLNGEVLTDDNNGSFSGTLNPVYDDWGLPQYYQRSEESYDKGTELYDRNGDFVRYQDSDNLERYNNNAYRINCYRQLHDGKEQEEKQNQKKLYHRQGEGYILENTWLSSDKTPNDPFHTEETEGQPDILKRVPAGHYIQTA